MNMIGVTTVLLVLVPVQSGVQAQVSKPTQQDAAAGDVRTASAETPRPASERASRIGEQIRTMLSRPPRQMAAMARQLAGPLQASLRYDQVISQLETRERRFEEALVRLRGLLEEKIDEFGRVRQELENTVHQIQEQFSDDPQRQQAELAAAAGPFRDRLLQLQAQVKEYRRQVQAADEKLAEIRVLATARKRSRAVYAQQRQRVSREPVVPSLDLRSVPLDHALRLDEALSPRKMPHPADAESFEDIMETVSKIKLD